MIRVELRQSHRLRWLLIAALAGAVAGMGLITLPTAWDGPLPPVRDLYATWWGNLHPARQEPVPEEASVPALPEMPRGTTACLRILRLGNQLSPPLRLTTLAADAGGGYHLEGSCRATEVARLHSILDTLKTLPATASLSYWRDRKAVGDKYRFAFRGRMSGFGGIPLPPVTAAEGELLFEGVVEQARTAGLRGVNADAVAEQGLGDPLRRKRRKFWASGSRSQIAAFTRAVGLPTQRHALVELLVVPGYSGEDADWENAQMFATIDVVVAAGHENGGS